LADYEVRTWPGWHHHVSLSLLAAFFLTKETVRAKKKGITPLITLSFLRRQIFPISTGFPDPYIRIGTSVFHGRFREFSLQNLLGRVVMLCQANRKKP
jgi:hypothetical protein